MVPRVSSSRSLTADQQHRPLDSMDTGKGGRGGTLPIPLISPFPAPPPLAERGEEVRVQEVVGQGEGGSGGLGTEEDAAPIGANARERRGSTGTGTGHP